MAEGLEQLILKTRNPAMKAAIERAQKASRSDAAILIIGESGVGKELLARYIHSISPRGAQPFVAVNCPALTETLAESELFGHEKGSFTGAIRQKKGQFELANLGTIFLDEIGDLSGSVQAKLLRVIEYKEFQRVGGEGNLRVDVRLISATNKPLNDLMADGRFREDLFFRINEITVHIPPLRDRPEDILLLADSFTREFSAALNKKAFKLSDAAQKVLLSYHWPGNVRELRSLIKRAVTLAEDGRDALWVEDLGTRVIFVGHEKADTKDLSLSAAEKRHVEMVLRLNGYNKSRTAEILGISRPTLDKKIADYGIDIPRNS